MDFDHIIISTEHISGGETQHALHVVFGTNAEYVPPMGILLSSLIASNPNMRFYFHIFLESVHEQDLEKLRTLLSARRECSADLYRLDEDRWRERVGQDSVFFLRILAVEVLGHSLKKMLYMDADTLCIGDLSNLLRADFSGAAFMAVCDTLSGAQLVQHRKDLGLPAGAPYFNSGVLYIDTAKWKECGISDRLSQIMKDARAGKRRLWFPDQDALNIATVGLWKELPLIYNLMVPALREKLGGKIPPDTVILHYAGCYKPWLLWEETEVDRIISRYCEEIILFRRYRQTSLWPDFQRGKVTAHDVRLLSTGMWLQRHYFSALKLQKMYLKMKLKP